MLKRKKQSGSYRYCRRNDNAWSREASTEIFDAVPHSQKEMHVIPEASHFDMYDLAPFVSEAF